jgi:hypothetical protein
MTKPKAKPQPSSWRTLHTYESAGVMQPYTAHHIAQPRQHTHHATTALYTGPKQRPYTARAGAMDAYALPSLVAGQPTPRKAPACTLTRK